MVFVDVKIGKKTLKLKDCRGISALRGLMFDSMNDNDGALMPINFFCGSLCMAFVEKKLNLVFLDSKLHAIKSEIAVPVGINPKTWKTYSCKNASYCLELKDIDIKIKKGDKVKILDQKDP